MVQLDKLKSRQSIITDRTNALRVATANTLVLYRSGTRTYLEVIVAERDLLESELELAEIKKTG